MRQYSDVRSPRQVEVAGQACTRSTFATMSLSLPRPFSYQGFSKTSILVENPLRRSASPLRDQSADGSFSNWPNAARMP